MAECGTTAGYYAHYRHGEKPCSACAAAGAAYQRDRYSARQGRLPAGRTTYQAPLSQVTAPGALRSIPLTTDHPETCLGDTVTGVALCGRHGTRATAKDLTEAVLHQACLDVLWGPAPSARRVDRGTILPRRFDQP